MIFKTLVEDENSQGLVLKSLHETWKNNQQVIKGPTFYCITLLKLYFLKLKDGSYYG